MANNSSDKLVEFLLYTTTVHVGCFLWMNPSNGFMSSLKRDTTTSTSDGGGEEEGEEEEEAMVGSPSDSGSLEIATSAICGIDL